MHYDRAGSDGNGVGESGGATAEVDLEIGFLLEADHRAAGGQERGGIARSADLPEAGGGHQGTVIRRGCGHQHGLRRAGADVDGGVFGGRQCRTGVDPVTQLALLRLEGGDEAGGGRPGRRCTGVVGHRGRRGPVHGRKRGSKVRVAHGCRATGPTLIARPECGLVLSGPAHRSGEPVGLPEGVVRRGGRTGIDLDLDVEALEHLERVLAGLLAPEGQELPGAVARVADAQEVDHALNGGGGIR